jgi:hypothetical protein
MITKIQYKKIDNKGIIPFTVKNDLTLEILTEDKSTEGVVRTFREGGTFYGELVACKLLTQTESGSFAPSGQGLGLMVRNEGNTGCWLVPVKQAIPMEDNVISAPKLDNTRLPDLGVSNEDSLELSNELKDDNKKILGFTYKQLIVIGVLIILIKNI